MRALTQILQSLAVVAATLLAAQPAFADATVILINGDPAGVGLNDPTPAAPVAGNTGATVGQQRLIALQHAANIWGQNLDSPVTIAMLVSFGTRTCTPTAAVPPLRAPGMRSPTSDPSVRSRILSRRSRGTTRRWRTSGRGRS